MVRLLGTLALIIPSVYALYEPVLEEGDNGASYRGFQTRTRSGRECMRWDVQSPHAHDATPENYPNSGLVHNYCRNPDGKETIWCFTTDPTVTWELCDPVRENSYDFVSAGTNKYANEFDESTFATVEQNTSGSCPTDAFLVYSRQLNFKGFDIQAYGSSVRKVSAGEQFTCGDNSMFDAYEGLNVAKLCFCSATEFLENGYFMNEPAGAVPQGWTSTTASLAGAAYWTSQGYIYTESLSGARDSPATNQNKMNVLVPEGDVSTTLSNLVVGVEYVVRIEHAYNSKKAYPAPSLTVQGKTVPLDGFRTVCENEYDSYTCSDNNGCREYRSCNNYRDIEFVAKTSTTELKILNEAMNSEYVVHTVVVNEMCQNANLTSTAYKSFLDTCDCNLSDPSAANQAIGDCSVLECSCQNGQGGVVDSELDLSTSCVSILNENGTLVCSQDAPTAAPTQEPTPEPTAEPTFLPTRAPTAGSGPSEITVDNMVCKDAPKYKFENFYTHINGRAHVDFDENGAINFNLMGGASANVDVLLTTSIISDYDNLPTDFDEGVEVFIGGANEPVIHASACPGCAPDKIVSIQDTPLIVDSAETEVWIQKSGNTIYVGSGADTLFEYPVSKEITRAIFTFGYDDLECEAAAQ